MIQPLSEISAYLNHPGVFAVVSERKGRIDLDLLMVSTEYRGLGLARKVVGDLCDYADIHGLKIGLRAADPFLWNQADLVEFYKKFRFRVSGKNTRDDCIPMIRYPRVIYSAKE